MRFGGFESRCRSSMSSLTSHNRRSKVESRIHQSLIALLSSKSCNQTRWLQLYPLYDFVSPGDDDSAGDENQNLWGNFVSNGSLKTRPSEITLFTTSPPVQKRYIHSMTSLIPHQLRHRFSVQPLIKRFSNNVAIFLHVVFTLQSLDPQSRNFRIRRNCGKLETFIYSIGNICNTKLLSFPMLHDSSDQLITSYKWISSWWRLSYDLFYLNCLTSIISCRYFR